MGEALNIAVDAHCKLEGVDAYRAFRNKAKDVYPLGYRDPEVIRYLKRYHRKVYTRRVNKAGKSVIIKAALQCQPGIAMFRNVLRRANMTVKRVTSFRQRVDAMDPENQTWKATCSYSHHTVKKYKILLKNIKDGDEMWLFYEGDTGWKSAQQSIGRKGSTNHSVKATAARRSGCTVNIITTAAGDVLSPVFLGKAHLMGAETDRGRKLEELRNHKFPDDPSGKTTLGDKCFIHSNEAGFMNTEHYASTVIQEQLASHIRDVEMKGMSPSQKKEHRGMFWHDSTDIHNGSLKGVKAFSTKKGKKEDCREYLWRELKQAEGKVDPGFTNYRPNDQPMVNYMLKWRYKQEIALITKEENTTLCTYRKPTEFDVILAFLRSVEYLRARPHLIVSAWLKSRLVTREMYIEQGMEDLLFRAERAGEEISWKEALKLAKQDGCWSVQDQIRAESIEEILGKSQGSVDLQDCVEDWAGFVDADALHKIMGRTEEEMRQEKIVAQLQECDRQSREASKAVTKRKVEEKKDAALLEAAKKKKKKLCSDSDAAVGGGDVASASVSLASSCGWIGATKPPTVPGSRAAGSGGASSSASAGKSTGGSSSASSSELASALSGKSTTAHAAPSAKTETLKFIQLRDELPVTTKVCGKDKIKKHRLISIAIANTNKPTISESQLPWANAKNADAMAFKGKLSMLNVTIAEFWSKVAEHDFCVDWGLEACERRALYKASVVTAKVVLAKPKKPL